MTLVSKLSDEVVHILKHIEDEVSRPRANQTSGFADRAQKIRNLLAPMKSDNRNMSRDRFIQLLLDTATDAGLKTELNKLDRDDDGQKLRSVLRYWVRTGEMIRG